jgi:hypothetical protein
MPRLPRLAAVVPFAAMASLVVAAGPAVAQDRIKPKPGAYGWTGYSRMVFLHVTRDRRAVRYVEVGFFCGDKLQLVPVGGARINSVGRHSVGFEVDRRVRMPHGHKVRVRMSSVWSRSRKLGGTVRLRDPQCAQPPKADPPLDIPTWQAIWRCGDDCVPLFSRRSARTASSLAASTGSAVRSRSMT